MSTVRVNVHPRPNTKNWDISIPYHGNAYNQDHHVTDSYLSEWLAEVPTDSTVILVSDGAPVSRQAAVQRILERRYDNIQIESPSRSFRPDPLFNKPYLAVDRPAGFHDLELLKFYLEVWKDLELFSHRYSFASHSRDHGYFGAVKRRWYQWGQDMPRAPSILHQQMYDRFQSLFDSTVELLCDTLSPLRMDRCQIEKGLMFRLNHNPSDSGSSGYYVNRHGDNSIVTIWMAQTHPGAMIDCGQKIEVDPRSIDSLCDTDKQLLIFPGFDYCDISGSDIPATWHSVLDPDRDCDRVALVAFLKYL